MPTDNIHHQPTVTILLVEDDLDDIMLLQGALHDNHIVYKMDVVMEGDKVDAHLSNVARLPQIIILDFNLPKKHGKEILVDIKTDPRFQHIPVIVLTTSSAQEDIDYSYQHGASHFITKPTSVTEFNKVAGIISELVLSLEKE
jgi:CheY-like chemotaxis protein